MKANQIFNINRFILLYKQELSLNLKQILLTFGLPFAVIALIHTVNHIDEFHRLNDIWRNSYHTQLFSSIFVISGIIYNGISFPAFRNKSKAINYLLTPASLTEKFIFEFVNKIVLYIVLFPLIYWLSSNFISSIFHVLNPEYTNYLFSFDMIQLFKEEKSGVFLILSLGLFFFTIPFVGSSIYERKPLIKTVVFSFLIGLIYFGIVYYTVEGFGLTNYRIDKILWIKNSQDAILPATILAFLGHIAILVIAFFKLKEKEV